MNNVRNSNILFTIVLVIVGAISGCGAGKPKGGEGISYFGAAWLNNERIIYTKQVETVKFNYGWLAEVANMTSELIRIDYYICTMDLNGEDEKILKQFSVTDPMGGKGVRRIFLIDDGKEVPLNTIPQRPSIYSCSKDLIVFVAHFSEGGAGSAGPIYTMKPDGSEIKQIVGKGAAPRLSPDGKLILYTAAGPIAEKAYEKHRAEFPNEPQPRLPGSLWLINTDGTGKRKLVEPGSEGIWDPTGRKILYNEGPREYDCHLIELDANYQILSNKKFEWGGHTEDWSSDGKYVLAVGTRDTETWNEFKLTKLAAIPDEPRLSPDGEKIVGSNAGLDADICIVYINSTDREKAIKVLKKTHFKKWEN